MTDLAAIRDILEQYRKHGWTLRRASLSKEVFQPVSTEIGLSGADISEGSDEFFWFSRRSLPDREAWELRRLSGSPFALVAVIEDSLADDEREAILRETERRMFDGSHPEPTSH